VIKDPYEVLGVSKDASQDAIRKAYRTLAKELHPDLNPGDTSAAERFKEVSAAYEILKDPEKRKRYDRGEIDAEGHERPHGFYREYAGGDQARHYHSTAGFADFEDVSDLFADMFARAAPGAGRDGRRRGRDVRYHLEVDFLDAVRGGKQRVVLPDGQGLDVTIPEGTADGQTLRLKGKGEPGLNGGPAGDALVLVRVRPHPVFRREGDDIHVDLPVAIDEAVLGAKIEVPTVDGKVAMTVPKGASGGQVLRLRGKGVRRGDQLVHLRIALPSEIDEELESFMRRWRESHGYDPRARLKETT